MSAQKIKDGDLCVVDFVPDIMKTAAVFTFDEKYQLVYDFIGEINEGELVIVIKAEAKSSREWSVVITRIGIGLVVNRKLKAADDNDR